MTAQSHWDAFSASSVAVNECIYHLMLYEDTLYVYFFVHFSLRNVLVPLYLYFVLQNFKRRWFHLKQISNDGSYILEYKKVSKS